MSKPELMPLAEEERADLLTRNQRPSGLPSGFGDEPEVTGPGESLLMAAAGRAAALADLSGEGLTTLRELAVGSRV